MRVRRRSGGRRGRPETPQEAWERMRGATGTQTTRSPQPARREPPAPASTPQPARVPEPRQRTAAEKAPTPNGGRGWDAPAPHRAVRPSPTAESKPEDAPIGELVKQLTEQTKTLVKQEMRLAQVELQEKGKKVGIGAGLFGAGGLVAFFGTAAVIVAIVLGLATALAAWLSALIVGVVLLGVAAVAGLLGKKQIEKATPPAPEQAIENVKRDVDTVKERARG